MKRRRMHWTLLALVGVTLLSGCTQVETQYKYAGPLPRPDAILVYNFAATPGEVKLDSTLLTNVSGRINQAPQPLEEIRVGQKVADALAQKLVEEIRSMGLPAERGAGPLPETSRVLMIEGQFYSINQGNQAERVSIGLGAGRSDVKIHAEAFDRTHTGRRLVAEYEVDAAGSRQPGMAETMGVGALAGNLAMSAAVSGAGQMGSEAFAQTVEADAKRGAAKLAEQLGAYFAQQGWISPMAVPQDVLP